PRVRGAGHAVLRGRPQPRRARALPVAPRALRGLQLVRRADAADGGAVRRGQLRRPPPGGRGRAPPLVLRLEPHEHLSHYPDAVPVSPRPCVCRRALGACDPSCSRDLLDVSYFTPFLNLTDRPCLVVGAGPVGLEKVEGLLASNAAVTVVAPRAVDEIA